MKLYHISNSSGEVEYCYIADHRKEVDEQLEGDEEIVGVADLGNQRDVTGMPTNRRLIKEN